jgi:hypothetical protein
MYDDCCSGGRFGRAPAAPASDSAPPGGDDDAAAGEAGSPSRPTSRPTSPGAEDAEPLDAFEAEVAAEDARLDKKAAAKEAAVLADAAAEKAGRKERRAVFKMQQLVAHRKVVQGLRDAGKGRHVICWVSMVLMMKRLLRLKDQLADQAMYAADEQAKRDKRAKAMERESAFDEVYLKQCVARLLGSKREMTFHAWRAWGSVALSLRTNYSSTSYRIH